MSCLDVLGQAESLDQPSGNERPIFYSDAVDARFRLLISRRRHVLLVGGRHRCAAALARAAVGLLPSMTHGQDREVTQIYGAAGVPRGQSGRPLRKPDTHLSAQALVGSAGGRIGEVRLAHRGILVLEPVEEFGEYALARLLEIVSAREVVTRQRGVRRTVPLDLLLIAIAARCACARRLSLAGVEDAGCQCSNLERTKHEHMIERLGRVCDVLSLADLGQSEDSTRSVLTA